MKKRNLRDIILGGQDGLVNVLGVILVMAEATSDVKIVILAGLAAAFAESLSMAGVGYTSVKAALDYYKAKLHEEKEEVRKIPARAKADIRKIYEKRGFTGKLLNQVMNKITSKKRVWVEVMMGEELGLHPEDYENPVKNAVVIGLASFAGSLVPLLPFFLLKDVVTCMVVSFILTSTVLFLTGVVKAKLTIGHWLRSGLEIMLVGMGVAIASYAVGYLLRMI